MSSYAQSKIGARLYEPQRVWISHSAAGHRPALHKQGANIWSARFATILVWFLFTHAAGAQSAAALPPAVQAQVERQITAEMVKQGIPGLSVAIATGGKLAWTAGFGMADVENNVPASSATVYRLASISKPVTAVAALQLYEAGKLKLDAPVQDYVPAFPAKEFPITLRQLLCHQGGIRHYAGTSEIDSTRHYADSLTSLDHFKGDSLVAEPGTKYSYTTFGYVLLGAAVEKAAEKPLMDYVRERIARPAGTDMLQADDTYAIIPNRARGYRRDADGLLQNCHLADTSNKIAGGGMCSRAQDLVAFALAVRQGKLLKPKTVEMMWTDQPARDGKLTAYGLGWRIDESDGRKRVSHSGAQQGVATVLVIYPKEDVVVALMCNLERVRIANLGYEVAKALLP